MLRKCCIGKILFRVRLCRWTFVLVLFSALNFPLLATALYGLKTFFKIREKQKKMLKIVLLLIVIFSNLNLLGCSVTEKNNLKTNKLKGPELEDLLKSLEGRINAKELSSREESASSTDERSEKGRRENNRTSPRHVSDEPFRASSDLSVSEADESAKAKAQVRNSKEKDSMLKQVCLAFAYFAFH